MNRRLGLAASDVVRGDEEKTSREVEIPSALARLEASVSRLEDRLKGLACRLRDGGVLAARIKPTRESEKERAQATSPMAERIEGICDYLSGMSDGIEEIMGDLEI